MMFVHGILSTDTDACAYVHVCWSMFDYVCVCVSSYVHKCGCVCMHVGGSMYMCGCVGEGG